MICIVHPNKQAYSETFIHAHIERLPAKVKVLYGGLFPAFTEHDQPLLSRSLLHRGARFALRKAFRVNSKRLQNSALRRYLRREKIEAVLAEYGPTGVSVMGACRAQNIPLIVHFHGSDAYEHGILQKYGKEYPRMFEIAIAVIAGSRDMECQLLKLGSPEEKLYYNPVSTVETSIFSGAGPAKAPPLFVAVGRFVDKKAPHLTLLAFKKVVDNYADARLVMLGDGPLLDACRQMARALHISSVVEFLGARPHAEVAAVMRTARAFVQHSLCTSYGDSEGTAITPLEAGASGLPVVATRHGGIRESMIDGKTGFLVHEGDIDGMADCMLRLAQDPELAARLGQQARKRICAEFSMEKSIGRLWEIIEEAIQKS